MDIGRIPAVLPLSSAERRAALQQAAAERVKPPAPPPEKKAPFDPLPAIRPTLQDQIDFNRTLLALRKL